MKTFINKLKGFFIRSKEDYGSVNLNLNMGYYLYELRLHVYTSDIYFGPNGDSHGFGQDLGVNLVDGVSADITTEMIRHPLHLTKFSRVRLDEAHLVEGVEFDVLRLYVNDSKVLSVMEDLSVYSKEGVNDPSKKPYFTIGYFKPGIGKKYLNKFKNFNCWVAPLDITYDKADNSKIKIDIDVI